MAPFTEGAGNVPQQAFVQWNDPQGTILAAINRDGTITTQGIVFPTGNTQIVGPVAIVQSSSTLLNINVPENLSATNPATILYAVSIYADSRGDGGGTSGQDQLTITLNWLDPSGFTPRNLVVSSTDVDGSSLGSAAQVVKAILAVAGSTITVTTSFTGSRGHSFHYDLAVRLVAMP